MKNRAVFLDRDGTIVYDLGYPRDPDSVELMPGVVQALRLLQENSFTLVIISNQSGVGRGILNNSDLANVHNRLIKILENNSIYIRKSYYCTHAPWEKCKCRKPKPAMLFRAAEEMAIDLASSFVVGDKPSDVEAGLKAGCWTIMIEEQEIRKIIDNKIIKPHAVFPDLLSASRWIVSFIEDTGSS